MITSARFVNINGSVVLLNDNFIPFKAFTTSVDTRMEEKPRSQRHGLYPGNTYLGKRLFHAEGDILGDNSADYWTRRLSLINAVLPRPHLGRPESGTLYMLLDGFSEELSSDCVIDGWPEIPIGPYSPSISEYQLNFKSFDPRLYTRWMQADIPYGVVENQGGKTFNVTYNRTYTSAVTGVTDVIVANSGNIETYPIITIPGPVTDPVITNRRSDGVVQQLRLIGVTLLAGEYVTVDLGLRTVTHYSGLNYYNYAIGSDWFPLESAPFTNTLRFTGSTGTSTAVATIKWRHAYMI